MYLQSYQLTHLPCGIISTMKSNPICTMCVYNKGKWLRNLTKRVCKFVGLWNRLIALVYSVNKINLMVVVNKMLRYTKGKP